MNHNCNTQKFWHSSFVIKTRKLLPTRKIRHIGLPSLFHADVNYWRWSNCILKGGTKSGVHKCQNIHSIPTGSSSRPSSDPFDWAPFLDPMQLRTLSSLAWSNVATTTYDVHLRVAPYWGTISECLFRRILAKHEVKHFVYTKESHHRIGHICNTRYI